MLRSADAVRAVAFYERLGIVFQQHRHGSGPEHFAAELSGCVFEIYPLVAGGAPTLGTRVGFCVEALDEMIEALDAFPGAVVSGPKESEWGWRAVVSDPDGHRVELVERGADGARAVGLSSA